MTNTIDTTTKLIIQFSGEAPRFIENGDYRIEEARVLLEEYDPSDPELEDKLKTLLDKSRTEVLVDNVSKSSKGFEFEGENVSYKGRKISGTLREVLVNMYEQNSRTLSNFQKFLDLLFSNPSSHAVKELYDYISKHNCVIDQDGWIIAWKSVDQDGWSWHGNTETVVESGETNEDGKILNVLGQEVRVDRNQVDDDRNVGCSYGLHAGSYEYASSFYWGGRLMEVKINPADVVSIPHDCNCQKMRVCAYTPLSLSKGKIKNLAVDTSKGFVQEVKSTQDIIEDEIVSIIEANECVEIRDIMNTISTKHSINDVGPLTLVEISQNLGFEIDRDFSNILDWEVSQEDLGDEDVWVLE